MNEKIMIVDDEITILEILNVILTKDSYNVSMFNSSKKALIAAKNEAFDLFLIDLGLPGLDGLSLIKKLRKLNNAAKYVIMTGNLEPEVEKDIELLETTTVIQKPFTLKQIRSFVKRQLYKNC